MYLPVTLYISVRYMLGTAASNFSRFVSWLSTIGIMLGVTALVTVLSVMNGFERQLENNVLKFIPHVLLTTHDGLLNPKCFQKKELYKIKGIHDAIPIIIHDVILQSRTNVSAGVMLGVNQNDYEPLYDYLIDTSVDQLAPGKYRIIIGDNLAMNLGVRRGDLLRLMVPGSNQFTPIGPIPNQRLFTIAGTYSSNSEADGYQLLVNKQDAARLIGYPLGYVTGWRVWLDNPLKINEFSNQLLPYSLISKDWRDIKGELFHAVRMEKYMMILLLSLIIIVALFNVISSLGLLIMEKKIDIAILQTQGMNRSQVIFIFIAYGTLSGMIGSVLGAILGVLLSNYLYKLLPAIGIVLNSAALPVSINAIQVITVIIFTILVSLLSTLYPAWRAANINPVAALHYE